MAGGSYGFLVFPLSVDCNIRCYHYIYKCRYVMCILKKFSYFSAQCYCYYKNPRAININPNFSQVAVKRTCTGR